MIKLSRWQYIGNIKGIGGIKDIDDIDLIHVDFIFYKNNKNNTFKPQVFSNLKRIIFLRKLRLELITWRV